MASFNTTGIRFFNFSGNSAISAFARVTVDTNGNVQCAGPTANDIGFLDLDVGPASSTGSGNVPAAVRLKNCPGTRKGIADTAITAWGYVYKSTTGYVTGANGTAAFSANAVTIGFAAAVSGTPVAATGLGSVFEIIPGDGFPTG